MWWKNYQILYRKLYSYIGTTKYYIEVLNMFQIPTNDYVFLEEICLQLISLFLEGLMRNDFLSSYNFIKEKMARYHKPVIIT